MFSNNLYNELYKFVLSVYWILVHAMCKKTKGLQLSNTSGTLLSWPLTKVHLIYDKYLKILTLTHHTYLTKGVIRTLYLN